MPKIRTSKTFPLISEVATTLEKKVKIVVGEDVDVSKVRRPGTPSVISANWKESRKFEYHSPYFDDFGTHSPRWTIPSSRKTSIPQDYPGPGHYQVPHVPIDHRLKHTICVRRDMDTAPLTSNIDCMLEKSFPSIRPMTISSLCGKHFYDRQETPAPVYMPPGMFPKKLTISQRYKEREPENTPGPCEYSPKMVNCKGTPSYSFSKTKFRSFADDIDDNPGPGAYNVTKPIRRAPRWTEKIRVLPHNYSRIHKEHERPWAINCKKTEEF